MNEAVPNNMLPRGLLIGAALLIFASLLLVTWARVTGYTPDRPAPSAVVESRDLRFEDRADGSIAVYASPGGDVVDTLAPGTNGFVRGVLRGLARERRADKVGPEAPFRLTRWADGRLSLDDPATGRHVDLEVFGPTNSGAFAEILSASSQAKEKP
jgi:putative photosynthetic complex assembly protein